MPKPRLYNRLTYAWKPGAATAIGLDPQEAGERLTRLHAEHGRLTADIVVDDARPEDSPLHPAFEWDDEKAAEAYRREQARHIIKGIVIVPRKDTEPTTRAFYRVSDVSGYVTRERVLSTDSMREEVLASLVARLKRERRIYEDFAELAGVVAAIDDLPAVGEPTVPTNGHADAPRALAA